LLPPTARFYAKAVSCGHFYFEMARRMGGVPLITRTLDFDYMGNVTSLQFPRAKESDMYDFIISEAECHQK